MIERPSHPKPAKITKAVEELLNMAAALDTVEVGAIANTAEAETCRQQLKAAGRLEREIEKARKAVTDRYTQSAKAWKGYFDTYTEKAKSHKAALGLQVGAWDRKIEALERKRAEEQRQAQERAEREAAERAREAREKAEAEARALEDAARQANDAESAARLQHQADATRADGDFMAEIEQASAVAPVIAPAPGADRGHNHGVRKLTTYRAEIVDPMTIVRAVAAGELPLDCVIVNAAWFNRRAKESKEAYNIAGTELHVEVRHTA